MQGRRCRICTAISLADARWAGRLDKLGVMHALVEDFLQHLRHERGQAEHTQRTYAALLGKFVTWAETQGLTDWKAVELSHLMAFLQFERERAPANGPKDSPRRLSSESLYLEIAAL